MDRRLFLLSVFLSYTASASAQITSGYGSTQSIPGLINHLLGINIYEPYQVLGITATVGVLWVATYVIFKVGIKKIDEGLEQDGHGSSGLAGALGIDDDNSRNLLAILTLLIVLTMMGTGGFMGIINGWRSLILLTFTIMLLAGLIFVLVGGTGGIIGGTAYVGGKSAQVTASGVEELQEGLDRIGNLEGQLEDDEANTDDQDDVEYDEEELEEILDALENAVDDLESLTTEEISELGEAIENLEEIIELLDLGD